MTAGTHGVAFIGAGIFAQSAHLPAVAATPEFSVKALYSRSEASVVALAKAASEHAAVGQVATYWTVSADESGGAQCAGDLNDLLARQDVETVILSLPILVQPDVILQAWRAGKNVISEKPIAKDVAAAKDLIELWEREFKPKGLAWIIAEQFPYEPSYVKAQALIAAGKIGEVLRFSFDFNVFVAEGSKYIETSWRKVPQYQGGFCLDGGVHWASGLRYMLPSKITELSAATKLTQEFLPPLDTMLGVVKTDSGAIGSFVISFGTESATSREWAFYGTKGSLKIEVSGEVHRITVTPLRSTSSSNQLEIEVKGRGVAEEFLAFAKALVAGPESDIAKEVDAKTGPRAALRDVEFVESVIKSGESGQWVKLVS